MPAGAYQIASLIRLTWPGGAPTAAATWSIPEGASGAGDTFSANPKAAQVAAERRRPEMDRFPVGSPPAERYLGCSHGWPAPRLAPARCEPDWLSAETVIGGRANLSRRGPTLSMSVRASARAGNLMGFPLAERIGTQNWARCAGIVDPKKLAQLNLVQPATQLGLAWLRGRSGASSSAEP